MRLGTDEAGRRLAAAEHGVLGTVHTKRGVDAVPVVFALDAGLIGMPIDRVKPKATGALKREHNLAADPRATLLVEHWDAADWTRLWWVRAELRWIERPEPETSERLSSLLAQKYPQYADRPFARVLVLRVVGVTGWADTARAASG